MAIAVWGPRDNNPWLGVLAATAQEHTGAPVPPPVSQVHSHLAKQGALGRILARAGLEQIRVEEVATPTHDASFEDYWHVRTALAGPLRGLLTALPPEQQAAIKETVRARLSPFQTREGLTIPGLAYIASARRPEHAQEAPATQGQWPLNETRNRRRFVISGGWWLQISRASGRAVRAVRWSSGTGR